nr:MAG TPA: Putative tail fiber protein [Caudoviricetes sp.]
MTRTIPLKIQNEYIAGDKVLIGAAGSHNDVVLRMEFSPLWEGLTKTVQFRDALGEKTIETLLTADLLEKNSTTVYMVPVPNGAKKYAGEMTLAVKGAAVSGDKETRATTAVHGAFTVGESKWDTSAETEQDVNATQAEQLQRQIDAVLGTINGAAASANAAAASAQSAAESAETATAAAGSIGNSVTAAAKSAAAAAASEKNAEYWAGQAQQAAGGGVVSFNGRAGSVVPKAGDYDKGMVGLGNVDNTSDLAKPISTATQTALNAKQGSIIKGSVTLTVAGWVADGDDWKQPVTIAGGAAGKQVDLEADKTAIKQMLDDGTNALYIANENGAFTAHAVGEKPTAALTLQTTMYDVKGAV